MSSKFDRYCLTVTPPPSGCQRCRNFVPNYWDETHCSHKEHFGKIEHEFVARGLQRLGSGGSRAGYLSKNKLWVYKVPHNRYGYEDNIYEYRSWRDRALLRARVQTWVTSTQSYIERPESIGHRIARCRLHPSGVLVMENMRNARGWGHGKDGRIKMDPSLDREPGVDEALDHIDGGQGGLNRNGVYQLYDYTHNTEIDDPALSDMMAL